MVVALFVLTAVLLAWQSDVQACTNILVSRAATADESTFITYAADSHTLYGELYHTPARRHVPGTLRDIYEWDTGKFLGRIPQTAATYNVVGNMNEFQVAIGETTFTGRKELKGPSGIIDYGSLMYIALERARTAREAIQVMTDLVAEHGYASTGESFSISDPAEVWLMEMIGKGEGQQGAVWVARRVPDGYITAHANYPRIRQFPLKPASDCMYAKDVIAFARAKGWFSGQDEEFSFAETYAPTDFGGQRFCESRVWSVFRRAAPSLNLPSDYARGVKGATPLPLWIKPDRKLSVTDVQALMRDHFEGTELDFSQDVGAGPYACPYRWRPMLWEVDKQKYIHERSISTQQTGFSFVAQSRAALPNPIGGILWFGLDDTFLTVYTPMYCGNRAVPRTFATGVASMSEFSWDSAFWVFNWVSNFTYSRYSDMIVDVQKVQREIEAQFIADQPEVERAAIALYQQAPELARDYLTRYSAEQGDRVTARWRKLGERLLVKYMDGNVKNERGEPGHPPYPEAWYRRIVKEKGDAIRAPADEQ
ncbi:MAG: C69 family dipeptidase [Vicinamibacteria bacterium]|jgi:dipeptidase|nr:C69 family dipeptidase [Vicinamibacteria bacterium]